MREQIKVGHEGCRQILWRYYFIFHSIYNKRSTTIYLFLFLIGVLFSEIHLCGFL